jgi:hypothetical protein
VRVGRATATEAGVGGIVVKVIEAVLIAYVLTKLKLS